jgi:phosphate transport system substrate-binding protein
MDVMKFFSWSYNNGQKAADELQYVAMPASVVAMIDKTWADTIKSADGKPVWTAGH